MILMYLDDKKTARKWFFKVYKRLKQSEKQSQLEKEAFARYYYNIKVIE